MSERPWCCRVVSWRRPTDTPLPGSGIVAGAYLAAGTYPRCRPAAVYMIESVGNAACCVRVVYAPASKRMVGRRFWWGRARLDVAHRLGDVRVVAAWAAPTETLWESRNRRLGGTVPEVRAQAAIAAGG